MAKKGETKFKRLLDSDWLRKKYIDEELSAPDIARIIGCSGNAVNYWMRKHGIPRTASHCPTNRTKEKIRQGLLGKYVGPKNGNYKGYKWRDYRGYIVVKTEAGYKHEHRVIMEKLLGRKLNRSEIVHHINGIKDDNRPENLELTTFKEHRKSYASAFKDGFAFAYLLFLRIKSQEDKKC